MKNDKRLCVVSTSGRHWHTLSYGDRGDRSISFKIRTYLPGAVDPRLKPFKIVTRLRSLARHVIGKNGSTPVIAKVAHVQMLTSWKDKDFAPAI